MGTLYTVYKLSQNGSVKFLHIGVLLYDADKRFNDVAAISVMNICVSVKRKPTPLSTKSTKKNGDFTSVFWHREKSPFGQQKSPIDSGFSQETSICLHILAELERLELSRRGLADLRP